MKQDTTLSADILSHIKNLELYTRRLLKKPRTGAHRARLRGTGFEFDQIREYQLGDDVRTIDWKSSARMNKMLVKQYTEERVNTVFIAVDISSSIYTGCDAYDKLMTHLDIAAILAFAALHAQDKVGLILFSDTVNYYMPPVHTRAQLQVLIQTLYALKNNTALSYKKTNLSALLQYASQRRKKNSMLIIISDFIDDQMVQRDCAVIGKMYDTIAVRCLMPHERKIQPYGMLTLQDAEAVAVNALIDMRPSAALKINDFLKKKLDMQAKVFTQSGIEMLDIDQGSDYITDLISFFSQRRKK